MAIPSLRLVCLFVAAAVTPLAGQEQVPRQTPGWPCGAGQRAVDPSYAAVTEGTGGHMYMFEPDEIAQSGSLMAWHYKHEETVFRAMGEMRQPPAREFAFPVDSMVDSLVIAVSLQCNQAVAILDPSGAEATGERLAFRTGKAVLVVHPAPGNWKVRLSGRGFFQVTAEAVGGLSLDRARFVEPGGRPGHEGLFPVKTPPLLGSAGLLEFALSKGAPEIRGIKVRMVDSEGRVLDTADAVDPIGAESYLVRIPALRHAAFRVVVEGVDERGWPFWRMQGPLTRLTTAQ